MRKWITGITALFMAAVLVFSVQGLSASSAILMDSTTGRILYEKNARERSLIASTTKIMTALIVCEQCNVLDRVRIPKEAVGVEGSSMYLKEGEVLTVQELLYGLMLHSGNDAASALAIYCGGTQEGFVQLMNDKARELKLHCTHFENPSGLDGKDHYSSAIDLALITAYAMKNPIFAKTVSTKSIKIGDRYLKNHNKLLWQIDGADGVKTGYTKAAGRILVSTAQRQGRRLIAVTVRDGDDWKDHKELLNRGFEEYQLKHLLRAGEVVGYREVAGGKQQTVPILAESDFFFPLAMGEKFSFIIQKPDFVYAPTVKGQNAGHAYFCIEGRCTASVPVQYGETVEVHEPVKISLWDRFRERKNK